MTLDISIPLGWQHLSPSQLQYVFRLIAADFQQDQVVANSFLRFTDLRLVSCSHPDPMFEAPDPSSRSWLRARFPWLDRVMPGGKLLFPIPLDEFMAHLEHLSYLKSLPTVPVRLPVAVTYGAALPWRTVAAVLPSPRAIDAHFHGIAFERFLAADALYQRILFGASGARFDFSSIWFVRLLQILYPGIREPLCTPLMCVCALYWMAGLKSSLARMYPDLFGENSAEQAGRAQSLYNPARSAFESKLRESINAQIRALCQGDITRRDRILATDTHTALAELDALAREAARLDAMTARK